MAIEIKNQLHFKVLEMSSNELLSTGGLSICDNCCVPMQKGYYIAVLNMTYCKEHYFNWLKNAINYPEDRNYESFVYNRMIDFINSKA